MNNLRGVIPEFVECVNPNLNIFCARAGTQDVLMRQPRRNDMGKQRVAFRDVSKDAWGRYKRRNVSPELYDLNYRCKLPLYRGEVPGWLPLIMEVDKEIVAFADMFFKSGDSEFRKYGIAVGDVACNGSIVVIDRYQGQGLGTYYSYLTDCIGKYFKMDFILGTTFQKDGMYHIRVKDGWEVTRLYNGLVDHRKRL
jgi:GNAT superfamily N-acetyltransferase